MAIKKGPWLGGTARKRIVVKGPHGAEEGIGEARRSKASHLGPLGGAHGEPPCNRVSKGSAARHLIDGIKFRQPDDAREELGGDDGADTRRNDGRKQDGVRRPDGKDALISAFSDYNRRNRVGLRGA